MSTSRPVIHIAAAILRRGDEIAMIRQAAPGEQPFWSVPSGQVEDGELVTEGLYHATVWTFEPAWRGDLDPRDPDGFVSEARFVPVLDAIAHLEENHWQSVTADYLREMLSQDRSTSSAGIPTVE